MLVHLFLVIRDFNQFLTIILFIIHIFHPFILLFCFFLQWSFIIINLVYYFGVNFITIYFPKSSINL